MEDVDMANSYPESPEEVEVLYGSRADLWDEYAWKVELCENRAVHWCSPNLGDLDNDIHDILSPLADQPGWFPYLRLASKFL